MRLSVDNDSRSVRWPKHLRWNHSPREHGHCFFTDSQGPSCQHRPWFPARQSPESVSVFTADDRSASSLQSALHLNATHKAETSLWGLAVAAREPDAVGICQELFSQPHDTNSARSWGYLERVRERRGKVTSLLALKARSRLQWTRLH